MSLSRWYIVLTFCAAFWYAPTAVRAQQGDGVDKPAEVVLRVWKLPDPKKTDAYTKADRAVIDAFQKRYPHIRLVRDKTVPVEGMLMDALPLLGMARGTAPDVVYVNFRSSDMYIQSGLLYPLDEFVAELPGGKRLLDDPKQYYEDFKHDRALRDQGKLTEANRKLHDDEKAGPDDLNGAQGEYVPGLRIAEKVWPVVSRVKDKDKRRRVWMMPFGTLVRVLSYRKDAFKKAGLDPEKPPRDWDELYRCAQKLTDRASGTYGMYFAFGPSVSWDWVTYLWSAGGNDVTFEDGRWRVAFDSEAGVTAMEYYLKLVAGSWNAPEGGKAFGVVTQEPNASRRNRMWKDGKIGMQMTYLRQSTFAGSLDPKLFGLAPVPKGPSGRGVGEINCTMNGIYAGAGRTNNEGLGERDPQAVRRAAWQYVWFVESQLARRIRTKVYVDEGHGQYGNPRYLKWAGYDELAASGKWDWLKVYEKALEDGQPEAYGPNCMEIYYRITPAIEECVELHKLGFLGDTAEKRRKAIAEILKKWATRAQERMIEGPGEFENLLEQIRRRNKPVAKPEP